MTTREGRLRREPFRLRRMSSVERSAERLHKRRDFLAVMQQGRSWASRFLVLRSVRNELPFSRLGVVAGKRVGKAVVRNRVKRRLREVVRRIPLKAGWDVVLIARPPAAQANFQQLKESIAQLVSRTGLNVEGTSEKRGGA